MELNDRVVLVTGGTHSIGGAIVQGLHAAGAKVMVTGIEDARGASLAASLGERAFYQRLDLREDGQIDACLEACVVRFGRLDAIVNCACSYLDSGLATSRADWLAALDVNVAGSDAASCSSSFATNSARSSRGSNAGSNTKTSSARAEKQLSAFETRQRAHLSQSSANTILL